MLKKYKAITIFLLFQNTLIQAATWVNLPYPQDIAKKLKDESKKVDLDEVDPITLFSLNDLFDTANINSIIISSLITQGGKNNQLTTSYGNPLPSLDYFFREHIDNSTPHPIEPFFGEVPNMIKNVTEKKLSITNNNYQKIKQLYKQPAASYSKDDYEEWFGTLPLPKNTTFKEMNRAPYFSDPSNNLPIQNIYFFKITRLPNKKYDAEYLGNLDDIVTSPNKIADLHIELLRNVEGDKSAKIDELKKIIQDYKNQHEFTIAQALVTNMTKHLTASKNALLDLGTALKSLKA